MSWCPGGTKSYSCVSIEGGNSEHEGGRSLFQFEKVLCAYFCLFHASNPSLSLNMFLFSVSDILDFLFPSSFPAGADAQKRDRKRNYRFNNSSATGDDSYRNLDICLSESKNGWLHEIPISTTTQRKKLSTSEICII